MAATLRDTPRVSSIHVVSPEALESKPVGAALRYWNALRGDRPYPSRAELVPRDMTAFLRNVVLAQAIDAGKDYEYRIAGDAHVQAYGFNFKGMRLTKVEELNPDWGTMTRAAYENVRITGQPLALRGSVGRELAGSRFSYHETVFLPLGSGGDVDHLMIVTAYTQR
jgi:hypothetical protein